MRVIIILLTLLTFSCVTEKKRLKICQSCTVKSERHDSIVEKIVEVPVLIKGEAGPIVYLDNPCKLLCDSLGRLKNVSIQSKKNNQTINIVSNGNGLHIDARTEDTIVKKEVKQKEVYNKTVDTQVKQMPCANEQTGWEQFCEIGFYIYSVYIIAVYGYKFIKKRFFA